MQKLHKVILLLALGAVMGVAAATSVFAQDDAGGIPESSFMVSGPVFYNPESKSYFEFRSIDGHLFNNNEGPNWSEANEIATHSTYKGVAGRLAIIRSVETHEFLLTKFNVSMETWIGLRYICGSGKSEWVDNTVLPKQGFVAWDLSRWNRDASISCANQARMGYMGVYYTSRKNLFRWQAAGWAKRFHAVLIEYPTGKP